MSGENIITPPQKGDPVTADWAGELTRAVNAAQTAQTNGGSLATPFGFSPEPSVLAQGGDLPENPMPFDVIGMPDNDTPPTINVYMAIPGYAPGIVPVTIDCAPVGRWAQQACGTATSAWVLIDSPTASGTGTAREARIGFADSTPDGGTRTPVWRIFVADESDTSAPSWAMDGYPIAALARWRFPALSNQSLAPSCFDGVTQFVRGGLHLFHGNFWLRGGTQATNYGESIRIGDSTLGYVTISAASPT